MFVGCVTSFFFSYNLLFKIGYLGKFDVIGVGGV